MVETIRDFRCQRAGSFCRFGCDGANFGLDKITGRGRQNNFNAKSDFRKCISPAGFTDKRLADVCDFVYSGLAVFDVAALQKKNFYQSVKAKLISPLAD